VIPVDHLLLCGPGLRTISRAVHTGEESTVTNQPFDLPWAEPGWLDEAIVWIDRALAQQGLRRTGPPDPFHRRPWSTVMRVPANGETLYFKATAPALRHEAAVTRALATWFPADLPAVLAADVARGWLLLPDMGETLRSRIRTPRDLEWWRGILHRLARLQIEAAARTTQLLALGALDRRLAVLPDLYAALLEETGALLIPGEDGLTHDQLARLRALLPEVRQLAEGLGSLGIPESIHHEDFHDANVFIRGDRVFLSDWGEAGVSHPFSTLLVTLRSAAYRLKLAGDDPALLALRDAYLEPWRDFAPRHLLLESFAAAQRLGMICRALTWHRVLYSVPARARGDDTGNVPGWLAEFAEATKMAKVAKIANITTFSHGEAP
jgi:hypothetical protein